MNERLEEIREHEIIADNECGEYERHKVDFYYEHVGWLIEQAERVEIVSDTLNQEVKYSAKLEQQNKRYRELVESMKSEINHALHSNKSKDVKRFYLENAVRFADEVLEGGANGV